MQILVVKNAGQWASQDEKRGIRPVTVTFVSSVVEITYGK